MTIGRAKKQVRQSRRRFQEATNGCPRDGREQQLRVAQVGFSNCGRVNGYSGAGSKRLILETEPATPIPELASLLLLGTGLAAAGVRLYRQRRLWMSSVVDERAFRGDWNGRHASHPAQSKQPAPCAPARGRHVARPRSALLVVVAIVSTAHGSP
jgi:hypothetical protein